MRTEDYLVPEVSPMVENFTLQLYIWLYNHLAKNSTVSAIECLLNTTLEEVIIKLWVYGA